MKIGMSLSAMSCGDRFCFSRKGGIGGGGLVHPKGADSMVVSGLRFRNTLVGSGWATAVGLRKQSSHLVWCPFLAGKLFRPVWVSGCQLSAVTIASSLISGCGLSHEHSEDSCKSTCMRFGGWNNLSGNGLITMAKCWCLRDMVLFLLIWIIK